MEDDQREIVSVVWKELGNRIEVTYAEGKSDRVRAGPAVAADIARDAGLTVVPTRDGMARWVKDPDTWNRPGSSAPDQDDEPAT